MMQYKHGSTWGMPQYNSYEPEGEDIQEFGGLLDKARSAGRDIAVKTGERVGERVGRRKQVLSVE